ncbi:MAG: TetR/AcrR family transcriptional regulator [Bacteroidota bacterium]
MMDISLESGVAIATIYQYFETKEDIFSSWFDRLLQDSVQGIFMMVSTHQDLDSASFIETAIHSVVLQIANERDGVKRLLNELPQVLLSKVVTKSERHLKSVLTGIAEANGNDVDQSLNIKLTVLINSIFGFLIQMVLREEVMNDANEISEELTYLVTAYMDKRDLKFI